MQERNPIMKNEILVGVSVKVSLLMLLIIFE